MLKGHADILADVNVEGAEGRGRELSLWVTKGGNLSTEAPVQKRLPWRSWRAGAGSMGESGGRFRKAKEVWSMNRENVSDMAAVFEGRSRGAPAEC